METVLDYIEVAKSEADLVTGGFRVDEGELSKGNFVAHTIPTAARINIVVIGIASRDR